MDAEIKYYKQAILLIDGDINIFNACKSRYTKSEQKIRDEEKKRGLPREPKAFTAEEDRAYIIQSFQIFKKELDRLLEEFYNPMYLMAIQNYWGDPNFRQIMYPEYKEKRNKSSELAEIIPVLRQMALSNGYGIPSVERETDDYLRIWAEQCRAIGQPYVVVSIDKDLKMIPGKHYHFKRMQRFEVSEQEAKENYFAQLLSGDPTDNIPGLPGIGPIRAEQIVKGIMSEEELQEIVCAMYYEAFGADWEHQLLINGKLIHIQKTPNDYFNLQGWEVAEYFRELVKCQE